jgi:hypothetical protein
MDPHEAVRKHVQEKSAEELLAGERHLALPVVVGRVALPASSG